MMKAYHAAQYPRANRKLLPRVTGILFAFILVFLAAECAAAASSTSSPKIVSFSPKTGQPFTLVTIKGSSFNPSSKLTVTFSDGLHYSVSVPAISVKTTEVLVSLPPYFTTSGTWATHKVNIQIQEKITAKPIISSNKLSGLEIQAPPTSSMTAGSYTLAMLQAVLLADTNLQTKLIGTAVGTARVQASLKSRISALQKLIPQVQGIVSGSSSSFVIAKQKGANVAVNAASLAVADRFVLSLLKVLAKPPSALPDSTAMPRFSTGPATGANPVQVAAQASLNATGLPELNQAMANLVVSFETFAAAHPQDVFYGLAIGGAVIGVAAVLPAAVAALPSLGALVLASQLQLFIAFDELLSPVIWYSADSLSYAIPTVMAAGCAGFLDGAKSGALSTLKGSATDMALKLVIGGEYIAEALAVDTVYELYKCGKSIVRTPIVGIYTGGCTAAVSPVTCCSGGQCSTAPGVTTAGPTTTFPIPAPSKLLPLLCPIITTAFQGAGCASSSCSLQGSNTSSFTILASCIAPPVVGCTVAIATESCGFALK